MHPPLTDVEVRILGSLLEKEVTTPDNYPLSLNALLAACNQTTNREPVMRLDEDALVPATVALRRRGLLRQIQRAGSRVTKFEHRLDEELRLVRPELAVLGVLMLRGPQTPGELYARTERLHPFADLADLENLLDSLIAREPEPLVARLARRPGQKEVRYAHLLAGEPAQAEGSAAEEERPVSTRRAGPEDDRVAALERTVEELRAEVAALRADLDAFRSQFQ
ncbi:MAG TPA: YceH family protein [Longimicrobium sp.]|uniref:YceH family protein n=1 Tax=Longimicrobium sp. TaxID=2029185 RepID=UPI002F0117BA